MAINNPPKYRYPLFDEWDRNAFDYIKHVAQTRNWPKISASNNDKNNFLKILIRTQKSLHDWRAIFVDILEQVNVDNTIKVKELLNKYPPEIISKEKPAWVTYKEDEMVSDFIDELESRELSFEGNDEEMGEFVVRFLLSQLALDWEYVILMISELLGEEDAINMHDLNNEMKNFDYLKLFA